MNRRTFITIAAAAAVVPVSSAPSDLGWLRYADDIHLRVHANRLADVLSVARQSFRGYGVEVLDQDWCNVYIYSGPSPSKSIVATTL